MLPEAYARGYELFYGRKFSVDTRTYIPNKETEFLVNSFLMELKEGSTVIDVGTGCGSIAITIALEKSEVTVFAVDISTDALDVAKYNATNHGADIQFLESNYVDNAKLPSPDFIVADLPWGSPETILHKGGMETLKYMPEIALFHPAGPLGAQSGLLKSIERRGWHPKVFMETGLLPKDHISEIVPKEVSWEYRKKGNYSLSILEL